MKALHPDTRPTASRVPSLPLGRLAAAVLCLAPLLLAACADDVTANCPPLSHPRSAHRCGRRRQPLRGHSGVGAAKGRRAMNRRLIILVLLSPLLIADTCSGDDNPCIKPFPEVGAVVTTAEAAGDPCTGEGTDHILMWFTQGGVRHALRCGQRDFPKTSKQGTRKVVTYSSGFGYLHIRDDGAADGTVGHGDPVNDKAFAAAMQQTLDKGTVAPQGGGNWRYTVRYTALTDSCTGHWGFRVVLAKAPPLDDGHPLGVVTAFYLSQQPQFYP